MRVARGRGFAWASVGFVGLSASAFGAGSDVPDGSVVITGAQILAGITITGDTSDNTDFADSGVAPLSDCGVSTAPDEWYRIQIGGATGTIAIDVDGCGTLYDSKFFIRDSGASIVRCNDDGCGSGGGPSRLQNVVLAPGDYDLAIDGFLSESGAYEVVLREFVPLSCFLDPPCGGEPEGEPCDDVNDDTTNGGCLSTPNVFGTITIDGPAICGVTWANAGRRDTDWYAFSVAFPQLVVTHVRGEPDVVAFLLTMSAGGACPPIEVTHWPPAFSGACDTNQILDTFFQIDPGDYVLFVGPGTETGNPIFDGFPCPDGATSNNAYEVLISSAHHGSCCLENGQCLQGEDGVSLDFCSYVGGVYHGGVLCDVANCSGACCIESTCSDLEFDECLAAGGAYQGESTSCAGTTCPAGACCLPDETCLDGFTVVQCASVGAYQGDGTLCSGVLCAACPADLNGNGVVDFADILAIISTWGPCPPECPEDLDGSGDVGFGDILIVIGSWGACP